MAPCICICYTDFGQRTIVGNRRTIVGNRFDDYARRSVIGAGTLAAVTQTEVRALHIPRVSLG